MKLEKKIESAVLIMLVLIVGIMILLFALPLFLVAFSGASPYWLLIYAFVWPWLFMIQGVMSVDGDKLTKDIVEELRKRGKNIK